jgi:hypothetical protein
LWVLNSPELTIVAKLAADLPLSQRFSAVAAGTLCRVPETITAPTRDSSVEVVDREDALTTQRALEPQSLADDATACPNQRHNHDATRDKLQIKR